jgi:hypothetical protein
VYCILRMVNVMYSSKGKHGLKVFQNRRSGECLQIEKEGNGGQVEVENLVICIVIVHY